MTVEKFNFEKSPKTLCYVMENDTFNRRCNRCQSVVLKETNPTEQNYPYQCMSCDENLFTIETHEGKYHNDNEFQELLCNTRDLLLLDN
jgi:predicted SprT family Zn-dependent metalloprotease